jgi:hypothetical protein
LAVIGDDRPRLYWAQLATQCVPPTPAPRWAWEPSSHSGPSGGCREVPVHWRRTESARDLKLPVTAPPFPFQISIRHYEQPSCQ